MGVADLAGKALKTTAKATGTAARAANSSTGRKLISEGIKMKAERSDDEAINLLGQINAQQGNGSKINNVLSNVEMADSYGDMTGGFEDGRYQGPSLNSKKRRPMWDKMESISKAAHQRLLHTRNKMSELKKEAGIGSTALGVGIGTMMAGGAHMAMNGGVSAVRNKMREGDTEKIWKRLSKTNPQIANERGRENFEVLQQYAPDLATNPTVARSYLERAQQYNMTPHEFVKDLVQTQSQISRQDGFTPTEKSVASGTQMARTMGKESSLTQTDLDALDPR